jgi:hypothetical protein
MNLSVTDPQKSGTPVVPNLHTLIVQIVLCKFLSCLCVDGLIFIFAMPVSPRRGLNFDLKITAKLPPPPPETSILPSFPIFLPFLFSFFHISASR